MGASGEAGELVAFPGAEGFGRHAVGARGGTVYHVTTLADSGPGSLRDAVSVPNRTVVFEVGGVIELSERLIFLNNQTIAGQTAPGGGITLYGNGTSFTNANHTIVRYVRFRMGLGGDSGKDTITIARGHDMIFDHCSISWGRDGNFDLNQESGYELGDITLQDSIVAQGLQTHSTGGLVNASGVSVLRSLWIDNNSRNPKARQTLQWVNNVVYNWVESGFILGDTSGRSDGYLVGNYFITGPETNGGTLDSPTDAYHVYAADNHYDSDENGALDGRLLAQGDFGTASFETRPSADFPAVTELGAGAAFEHVVANAGASLFRDEADDYVVAELVSLGREGATISDEASLGLSNVVGDVPGGTAPADVDRDGMADAWELENGLDPGNADDGNADRNGDGWTNLEEYVNSRAVR
jgi:pectate lyase